jgi:hypothetical protein
VALVRFRAECRGRIELHEIDKAEIEIGRSTECDFVIDHQTVAPRHARILLRRGRLILADLGRWKTGTTRGRERVLAPVILEPGERFGVGDVALSAWPLVGKGRSLVGSRLGEGTVISEIDSPDRELRRYRVMLPRGANAELCVAKREIDDRELEAWLTNARKSQVRRHDHVPPVLGVGLLDDGGFYLLEQIPVGLRLAALIAGIERGAVRLPVEAAIAIVAHVAQSVAAMNDVWGPHGAIDSRRVHLGIDGSALLMRPGPSVVQPDAFADTYLAPERRYGSEPSIAADAFALGVLGKTVLASRPDCPTRIRAICCWLAHADPRRRPRDLQEVAHELRMAAQGAGLDPTFGHVARVTRLLSTSVSRRLCSVPLSGGPATLAPGSDEMLV